MSRRKNQELIITMPLQEYGQSKRLLDNSKFDRMVEAKTSDEALKVFLKQVMDMQARKLRFEVKALKDENKKVYELK